MRKGEKFAICIGVDDPSQHYLGLKPFSTGIKSSVLMRDLLLKARFRSENIAHFPGNKALYDTVFKKLTSYADVLEDGDLLILSFSGHGSKVRKDFDKKIDKAHLGDEGWCLFDKVIFFFELWAIMKSFKPGVEVVVISDSCYSGSLGFQYETAFGLLNIEGRSFFDKDASYYNDRINRASRPLYRYIPPAIFILSASKEYGRAYEAKEHTVFMTALGKVWLKIRKGETDYYQFFEDLLLEITAHYNQGRDPSKKQHPIMFYLQGYKDTQLARKTVFL